MLVVTLYTVLPNESSRRGYCAHVICVRPRMYVSDAFICIRAVKILARVECGAQIVQFHITRSGGHVRAEYGPPTASAHLVITSGQS